MDNINTQEPAGYTQQVPVHLAQCSFLLFLTVLSSMVALTPLYLFHHQPHSLVFSVEWRWGTFRTKGWEINVKTKYSSWGTSSQPRQKPYYGTQRFLFTSCPSVKLQSEDLHKYMLCTVSTWPRDHQQKWLQTETKWLGNQAMLGHF